MMDAVGVVSLVISIVALSGAVIVYRRNGRIEHEDIALLKTKIQRLQMQNEMLLERIAQLQAELDEARQMIQVLVDENRWYRHKLKMHGLDVTYGSEG